MMKKTLLSIAVLLLPFLFAKAQETAKTDTFQFTVVKELPITSVKNQASSSTCWSFSGLGLFEAELLRLGKPEVDLSAMFVVYRCYSDQADKYVRTQGNINFAPGGSFYDVLCVLKNDGIVPDELMRGLNYGEELHRHGEMDAVLAAYVKTVVQNKNRKLSTAWKKGFDGILNAYLGEPPTEFVYKGKTYTPQSYMQSLGLNMDDYVSLTSFTHHPFYEKFAIEIPDNWRWSESYNLPLDELMRIFDYAIDNGYTVAWGADVSEKGFNRNGLAVNPETNTANMPGSDQAHWLGISQREMEEMIFNATGPQPEVKVTQELRQAGFENYQTTDDHGMLIYGTAKDQNGKKYYLVKNSWGTDNKYKGIWYASESFVAHKTINIMTHKNAIPKDLKEKLGIR
ncbi:MAG: aminopeptidase [Prevotellaceae bacterium]|jgi:aminopeptidase C|nr:aminopeptidase [Prevotellaceae bacterium]